MTLVERLRKHEAYLVDYHQAADRIEALAGEKTILLGRIEDLVVRVEALEKALREIETAYRDVSSNP